MTQTIWKYPLLVTDTQIIAAPQNASALDVQFQDGTLCLWMLLDDSDVKVNTVIHIYGTGNPIPYDMDEIYVGTVQEHLTYQSLPGILSNTCMARFYGGRMTEDEARHQMIVNLDVALHGDSIARDMAPYEVWSMLLNEVMALRERATPNADLIRAGRKRRADLRAKVEALKATGTVFAGGPEVIRRADVLALFDGSSE